MQKLILLFSLLLVTGCSTASFKEFHAEGAKASAFCGTGGPGGRLGVGPSGIVTGAKANDDFIGVVNVGEDCSINIQSYPSPKAGGLLLN